MKFNVRDNIYKLSWCQLKQLLNLLVQFNCDGIYCGECPLAVEKHKCLTALLYAEFNYRLSSDND